MGCGSYPTKGIKNLKNKDNIEIHKKADNKKADKIKISELKISQNEEKGKKKINRKNISIEKDSSKEIITAKEVPKKEEKELKIKKEEKEIIINKENTSNTRNKKDILYKDEPDKYLTISDNVLKFLPEDITKEEIKQMVNDAMGNSIVAHKDKYIKGKNFTNEQVNCIIDILYNKVKKKTNIDEKYNELLKGLKINIEFRDINKQNIKEIVFKDYNPTKDEIEEILNLYKKDNDNPKFFIVEIS